MTNALTYRAGNQVGHRRAIDGLASPFPLGDQVPSMLADDEFLQRFLAALDNVISPALNTLDCLPSYFDPWLAPIDFVKYLGSWMLVDALDEDAPEDAIRHAVDAASYLSTIRGTQRALEAVLVPRQARSITVDDSGSVAVSTTSTQPSDWPEVSPPLVKVIVELNDPDDEQVLGRISRLTRNFVPAHVQIEVLAAT